VTRNELADESLLHLLSHIYVQRSHALWKDPIRSSWFAETVTGLVRTSQLPPKAVSTTGFARLQGLVRRDGGFDMSIYRHVIVLGSPAQSLLSFIPTHIINNNRLACDPLPPPGSKSQYNEDFFRGAEVTFNRHRNATQTQRLLERLIPDPVFRRQLQVHQRPLRHGDPSLTKFNYRTSSLHVPIFVNNFRRVLYNSRSLPQICLKKNYKNSS
jgi:hypothetical protein